MNSKFTKEEYENRERLLNSIQKIQEIKNLSLYHDPKNIIIGGLMAVGFSDDSRCLLSITNSGRGIYNLTTGERIDRDKDDSFNWYNINTLECNGFGILENKKIKTMGIYGGGFPTTTSIGESLTKVSHYWPKETIIYGNDYNSWYINPEKCSSIFTDYEIRSYGFSSNERYIVIATSSEILIYEKYA